MGVIKNISRAHAHLTALRPLWESPLPPSPFPPSPLPSLSIAILITSDPKPLRNLRSVKFLFAVLPCWLETIFSYTVRFKFPSIINASSVCTYVCICIRMLVCIRRQWTPRFSNFFVGFYSKVFVYIRLLPRCENLERGISGNRKSSKFSGEIFRVCDFRGYDTVGANVVCAIVGSLFYLQYIFTIWYLYI